jgi:hypothetical protein
MRCRSTVSHRRASVAIGGAAQRVLFGRLVAAERNQRFEQRGQRRLGGRRHLECQVREVGVGAADLEVEDLERAAALDDRVEDGRHQLRVDEMSFGGDDGGGSHS